MFKKLMLVLGLLVFAGVGAASAQDGKGDVHFGWLSVGTSHVIREGHIFFVGEFSGINSDMGAGAMFDHAATKCPASFDVNFLTQRLTADGHCTTTLTTGDAYYVQWHCEGSLEGGTGAGPYPLGQGGCVGDLTVTGATGALEGMTGGGTFVGYTILFHPDGTGSGYSILNYDFDMP